MTDPAAADATPSFDATTDASLRGEVPAIAASPLFPDQPASRSVSRAPVGPGMWEAVLWMIAFFAIEIGVALPWYIGVGVYHGMTGGDRSPAALEQMIQPVTPWIIGTAKFVEVMAVLIAIRLRFGRSAFRVTGFRNIPAVHAGIMCFAVLPTAFVSGQLYALLHGYWDRVADRVPALKAFDELSSIDAVQEMAASTWLSVLVLIIAVLPALNEEFMFRAAIGRGLLGRYGLVAGISLTTMLFAAMHLHPIHAAALVPLAVMMHVGYLSSGSIWWPVGMHFLNNVMSVVVMKLSTMPVEEGGLVQEVAETQFSPLLFVAALACVAATVWLLMKMRVQWRRASGELWQTERLSVEAPSRSLGMTRYVPSPPASAVLLTCATYLLFPVALVITLSLKSL